MPPTTEQLQQAAVMRAQGASYTTIAESTGLTLGSTYHHLKKDEINQLIKDAQITLINGSLRKAVDNQSAKIEASGEITHKIRSGDELTPGAIKLLELGHDAEKQVLQSVGIHNAHTQSITLNSIMIDARTELSPTIERMLTAHLSGDIVEAEVVDN